MNELKSLSEILTSTPENLLVLLALVLLAGLVIGGVRHYRHKQRATTDHDTDLTDEEAASQPSNDDESLSYKVDDVDALTEVDVFIQFGYLDQAASALRWYVDSIAPHSGRELKRLAGLYLQLGQLDDYAEILERLHDLALLNRDELEQSILEGLKADRNNLALRVLAEQRLALGVSEMNAKLGEALPTLSTEELLQQAAASLAQSPPSVQIEPTAPQTLNPVPLIEGRASITTLSQQETSIIKAFIPAARQARLLLSCHAYQDALPALQRLLNDHPRSLSPLLDVLRVHYMGRNLPEFTRHLWSFHMALGQYGQQLKERLLQLGLQLGTNPALSALALCPDRLHLEVIGREYGYIPASEPEIEKLSLIEVVSANPEQLAYQTDALSEADHYIEYGQVDMAISTLENAIMAHPEEAQYYPPLLDLYERLNDLERFTVLTRRIKDSAQRPPEEITAMMSTFVQRMQQRIPQRSMAA